MSDLRVRRVLALGAVVLALSAQALPATAKAKTGYANPVVSKVMPIVKVSSHGTAVVRAHYTCHGGPGGHLYIGVKQGPQVNDTDHTSSAFAETFYSTNYNSDGPGLTLTCDGKAHTQAFRLAPDPYWAGASGAPQLKTGPVFVQFCIFDATYTGNDEIGFGFDYSMKRAQRAG